jgi:hypothetical protein
MSELTLIDEVDKMSQLERPAEYDTDGDVVYEEFYSLSKLCRK